MKCKTTSAISLNNFEAFLGHCYGFYSRCQSKSSECIQISAGHTGAAQFEPQMIEKYKMKVLLNWSQQLRLKENFGENLRISFCSLWVSSVSSFYDSSDRYINRHLQFCTNSMQDIKTVNIQNAQTGPKWSTVFSNLAYNRNISLGWLLFIRSLK